MTRFRWTAKQARRIVADGTIDASTDRDGMQQVLASRPWKGRDFSLKVGDAQLSFDEEDLAKLVDEVANQHVSDVAHTPVPKAIVQGAIDALKHPVDIFEDLAKSIGAGPFDTDEMRRIVDRADLPGIVTEETYGVAPDPAYGLVTVLPDRSVWHDGRQVGHAILNDRPKGTNPWPLPGSDCDVDLYTAQKTPCCGANVGVHMNPAHPARPCPVTCSGCGKQYNYQVKGILIDGPAGASISGEFVPVASAYIDFPRIQIHVNDGVEMNRAWLDGLRVYLS